MIQNCAELNSTTHKTSNGSCKSVTKNKNHRNCNPITPIINRKYSAKWYTDDKLTNITTVTLPAVRKLSTH